MVIAFCCGCYGGDREVVTVSDTIFFSFYENGTSWCPNTQGVENVSRKSLDVWWI